MTERTIKCSYVFSFTGITYFSLAGMCKGLSKKVDTQFVLDMETAVDKRGLVFTGFRKTMMVLDVKINRWSIISMDDHSVIMKLDVEVSYNSNIIASFAISQPENMEYTLKYLW